ncbi:hypothetical protein [Actinacidiphila soli]|uniref:hypothetical protein n=1 Tax=Actinacidiphila soli TaxID=2487275 RepID=UPI0019D21D62|nr:hypothetical protein [Actinacidiphila soli]
MAVHSDAGDSEQVSDLLHGPLAAVVELLRERGLLGSTANLISNAAPDREHLADKDVAPVGVVRPAGAAAGAPAGRVVPGLPRTSSGTLV